MSSPVIFEGSEATNMSAHYGSTAILGCKIRNNQEDNPVSAIFTMRTKLLMTIAINHFIKIRDG